MRARWAWNAQCNACNILFSGFSGGPDDCPACGSDNAVEIIDPANPVNPMRTFETGATRDGDSTKLDYEGFLSPAVLRRYAEYMNKHRVQPDGALRASDNWQKGIPVSAYMKSLFRHFMDVWSCWRNGKPVGAAWEEALCAMLFNVQGLLFETLRDREIPVGQEILATAKVGYEKFLGGAGCMANQAKCVKGSKDGVQESAAGAAAHALNRRGVDIS